MVWFRRKADEPAGKASKVVIAEGLWIKCDSCKEIMYRAEVERAGRVCPKCHYPFRISARERLGQLADPGSFEERETGLATTDPLAFKDTKKYRERIRAAAQKTTSDVAVICGIASIGGHPADRGDAADHRLVARGLLGGGPYALAVFLGVLEGQRIGRRQTGLAFLERARIGELPEALARRDPEGVVSLRAHAPRALHLGAVHDLLARVALDPEAFGDDDLARLAGRLVGLASEPHHESLKPRAGRPGGPGRGSQPGSRRGGLGRGSRLASRLGSRRGGLGRGSQSGSCRGGLGGVSQPRSKRSFELGNGRGDVLDQRRRARPLFDEAHDRRADDRAVGKAPDRRDLSGRTDAESDAHRFRCHESERSDLGGEVWGQLPALASHAGE